MSIDLTTRGECTPASICPICFSAALVEFNQRPSARCTSCGSFERGRLAWMTLSRIGQLRKGVRMLNIAPEPFMLTHARRIIGPTYVAGDYSPEKFRSTSTTIVRIDLCSEPLPFSPGSFDVIMHNHVLEHVQCSVPETLNRLNDLLVPGGWHVFSVPISASRHNEEDLTPGLSRSERKRRFGQEDHLRVFGRDFCKILDACSMSRVLNLSEIFDAAELERWSIPAIALSGMSAHSIFAWSKPA